MSAGFIWGLQALAGLLLIWLAAREHNRGQKHDAEDEKKERGRGVYLDALSDAWKKAKRRGVAGYDRSLGFCALSECIVRLRRGEDIDAGAANMALGLLGLRLEEDGAGGMAVCEN